MRWRRPWAPCRRARFSPPVTSTAAFVRWPASGKNVQTTFNGPPERAAVEVMWPLWVGSPDKRRDERAMRYVGMILQDALRHRLRDKLGETYAPAASTHMDDNSYQGAVTVLVEVSPGRTEEALTTIRDVAADMAARATSPRPARKRAQSRTLAEEADRHTDINWWVHIMDGSARNPVQIDDARTWDAGLWLDQPRRSEALGPRVACRAGPVVDRRAKNPARGHADVCGRSR